MMRNSPPGKGSSSQYEQVIQKVWQRNESGEDPLAFAIATRCHCGSGCQGVKVHKARGSS